MLFFYNDLLPEEQQVLHRKGCKKQQKIPNKHAAAVHICDTNELNKPLCPACNHLNNRITKDQAMFAEYQKHGLIFKADIIHERLYVKTDIGFWYIHSNVQGKYKLFHRNTFHANMSWGQLMNGKFHEQSDRTGTTKLSDILEYILRHDQAKKILYNKGYQGLPTDTKQQKKYYASARKKAKDAEARRVWRLLESKEFSKYGANPS